MNRLDAFLDRSITIAIGIKLCLVASMLVVLAGASGAGAQSKTAQAQEIVCKGKNIFPALKAEDPAAYAAILSEADKLLNGESLFWKIEKEGSAPSWLLGTMHMADPRVVDMPEAADKALQQASAIAVEIAEAANEEKMAAAMMSLRKYTMLTDGSTLEDKLSPDLVEALKAKTGTQPTPWFLLKRMQPWVVAAMITLPECELARKRAKMPFLDRVIAQKAAELDIPLEGLETIEEQIKAIAGMSPEFHLEALSETIKLGDRVDDMVETMIRIYESGQIGLIWPLLEHISRQSGGKTDYADFQAAMIDRRNQTMLDRAVPLIEKGKVFIAVGALHLPGEKGLVNLLQEQGYKLTPLVASTPVAD
ncbi:MAG: TraB/GumN family protein [Pseudomonadota bacterium]